LESDAGCVFELSCDDAGKTCSKDNNRAITSVPFLAWSSGPAVCVSVFACASVLSFFACVFGLPDSELKSFEKLPVRIPAALGLLDVPGVDRTFAGMLCATIDAASTLSPPFLRSG
jgi:hypothetical protein